MPLRMQTFDSNGPDVRIRGSAFQVHEKYLQLARDASSSGDRIIAESYLQHAEHYYRIIAAAQEQQQQQNGGDPNRRYRPDSYAGQDFRGAHSEDGSGEGGDEFPSDEQAEGQAPRGDGYRQEGRQQEGRQQQDPAYRPQPETQFRGDRDQGDRNGQDRGNHQERNAGDGGNYRRQGEGEYRGERDAPYRQQTESGERREGGEPRPYLEDRPRGRNFDNRQGGDRQNGDRQNGRGNGERRPNGGHVPINPMTPAQQQIELPQPVMTEAAPAEIIPPEIEAAAPAAPRRGRPRRVKIEAPEPAEG